MIVNYSLILKYNFYIIVKLKRKEEQINMYICYITNYHYKNDKSKYEIIIDIMMIIDKYF